MATKYYQANNFTDREDDHIAEYNQPLDNDTVTHKNALSSLKNFIKNNALLLLTLLGVILGVCLGIGLRFCSPTDAVLAWIGLPGNLVIRSLKMCIIPLLVSNIIVVMGKTNPSTHGLAGLYTLTYAVSTNLLSALTAFLFVLLIQPGKLDNKKEGESVSTSGLTSMDIFYDLLVNIVPQNLFEASLFQSVTRYTEIPVSSIINITNATSFNTTIISKIVRSQSLTSGTNILGLVAASIVFGLAAGKLKNNKNSHFVLFFEDLSQIILIILNWIVWLLPIAAGSLLAVGIASVDNLSTILVSLGRFIATTLLAVFSVQFAIIPAIYFVITRQNPISLFAKLHKVWITAFVSMSSAVTIPCMYEASDKAKLDVRISRFVLPLAINCNANGSTAFIFTATAFMAQYNGINLEIGSLLLLILLSALAVLALPAVPSSSIVAIVILMGIVGAPATSVSLLFTTEFILDRARTTTNVVSHVFCCAIINKLCLKSLNAVEKGEQDACLSDNTAL